LIVFRYTKMLLVVLFGCWACGCNLFVSILFCMNCFYNQLKKCLECEFSWKLDKVKKHEKQKANAICS
jgi:hypothetical protein